MFGRVVLAATLCVSAALLGSFSLLARLDAPGPVAAVPAPAAAAADALPPALAERESSGYREALLEAALPQAMDAFSRAVCF